MHGSLLPQRRVCSQQPAFVVTTAPRASYKTEREHGINRIRLDRPAAAFVRTPQAIPVDSGLVLKFQGVRPANDDNGYRTTSPVAFDQFCDWMAIAGGDPGAQYVARELYRRSNELIARPLTLELDQIFPPGAAVKGEVETLDEKGRYAIVRLSSGHRGWLPQNEVSWLSDDPDLSHNLPIGTLVVAKVTSTDANRRSVVLSLREMQPDPWPGLLAKYPVGIVVSGMVRKWRTGIRVELQPGLLGWVPTDKVIPVAEGDVVRAKVVGISQARRHIRLSLTDTLEDPWIRLIPSQFAVGSEHSVRVTELHEKRVMVASPTGVVGVIPISRLNTRGRKVDHAGKVVAIGQSLVARVEKLDLVRRQIVFSNRV
jgi:ribosomal protein S1